MRNKLLAAVLSLGVLTTPWLLHAQAPVSPVVVELFTSQGCSSCPPANATLSALAGRADVLALTFSVTYWDQLGWKDTYADPLYTARQWDYAHGLHHSNVFTPQIVVQGRADTVGQSVGVVEPLIRAARAQGAEGPNIALGGDGVTLSAASTRVAEGKPADVWLVRYDPRIVEVPITAGENGGRTLPQRNVVHELIRLGGWFGRPVRFELAPPKDPHLRDAILVQAGRGGAILAAVPRPMDIGQSSAPHR